jgi:hypothetical protein
MSKKITPKSLKLTETEILDLRSRVCGNKLTKEDLGPTAELVDLALWLQNKIKLDQITLDELRKILLGNKTKNQLN